MVPAELNSESIQQRNKVLFFAEGATLAHVVRPLMLARGLDLNLFEPILCRPKAFANITRDLPFQVLDLESQEANIFAYRLDRGIPLYDFDTLCGYVNDDLKLINQTNPDVIVGDFRLSLSVSARIASVPYVTICDAYWSPEQSISPPPLPVLRYTKLAPIAISEYIFGKIAPLIFHFHSKPIERLRSKFGLPPLNHSLQNCYTDADLRLFANFPALFPDVRPSSHADFLGPIAWSPEFPGNLAFLEGEGPLTYVTMGSSGNPEVIDRILPILEEMGGRIAIATAGKHINIKSNSKNIQIHDYLPGTIVCQHADLVVCNGGSPTTNQALTCGVPVLGICQNMDQFLNMAAISTFGAGILMRSDRITSSDLRNKISNLKNDSSFSSRAKQLSATLPSKSPQEILSNFVRQLSHRHKNLA